MLQAVIFDLNGIFVQGPKLSERFQTDFGIPVANFLPILSQIMDQVRQPNARSIFSYWQPALQEWGIAMTETDFIDYWFKEEKVSPAMVNLASQLRQQGIKVFILSNNFKERTEFYNRHPWLSQSIDKAYYSFQTGHVKPDPRAWQQVLTENNLQPGNCLYFDDQQINITIAQSIGIPAYLFESEAQVQSIISQFPDR